MIHVTTWPSNAKIQVKITDRFSMTSEQDVFNFMLTEKEVKSLMQKLQAAIEKMEVKK